MEKNKKLRGNRFKKNMEKSAKGKRSGMGAAPIIKTAKALRTAAGRIPVISAALSSANSASTAKENPEALLQRGVGSSTPVQALTGTMRNLGDDLTMGGAGTFGEYLAKRIGQKKKTDVEKTGLRGGR